MNTEHEYLRGITERGEHYVDHCPTIGLRDCLRALAAAPNLVPEDPTELAAVFVARAAADVFDGAGGFLSTDRPVTMWTHRLAADRMRMEVIDRLQAAFRPCEDARMYVTESEEPEADTTARSRLFRTIETHPVHPIDANAARVGGDEPAGGA